MMNPEVARKPPVTTEEMCVHVLARLLEGRGPKCSFAKTRARVTPPRIDTERPFGNA
jgi:hypothetical protein